MDFIVWIVSRQGAHIQPHRTVVANGSKGAFFFTGATGFIVSALVPELINAGHQVLRLTRSEAGAQSLIAAEAQVYRGDFDDLERLRRVDVGRCNPQGF